MNQNNLDILDEQEETYIQQFVENERMREAVKKVLLAPLYGHGVMKKGKRAMSYSNWVFNGSLKNTNENLGALVRARAEGIAMVEEGFELLSRYKKQENKVENKINQAR